MEDKKAGSDKWSKSIICTSESCWLGRGSAKGGIIGSISATKKHVNSIATILSLKEEGCKSMGGPFAMLIHLRLNWEGGTVAIELVLLLSPDFPPFVFLLLKKMHLIRN